MDRIVQIKQTMRQIKHIGHYMDKHGFPDYCSSAIWHWFEQLDNELFDLERKDNV